jgi:hypothetical protein
MGKACSRYVGEERCIQGFGGETWMGLQEVGWWGARTGWNWFRIGTGDRLL